MPTRSSGRRGKASDPTTAWAEAAVRGDFVVGELVRHAAERHLRDLRDLKDYHWRPDLAQRALDFFPSVFTITDGPKAGEPFHLLPYHVFCVGSLMGWVTAEGRWRFRSAYIETGKGQAKSPMMGGLGIYAMGWCGFPRAPVYAIGGDKNTANVLFKDAAAMCRAQIPGYDDGETLETEGHVVLRGEGDNVHKIEHPSSQSFFLPLASGENQSGPRPRLVLADEIHEFRTDSKLVTWRRAITKVAGSARGFALGGFTGNARRDQVAGVVHGQEYVFDAPSVQRIGVDTLDALRAGNLTSASAAAVPSVRSAERAAAAQPGLVMVEVASNELFHATVTRISGNVAAQVSATAAPAIVGLASGKATSTMAQRARRQLR